MMFLTNSKNIYSEATASEIEAGLSLLKSLPSRSSDTIKLDKQAYLMALEGVTKFGLAEAIKATLQGKLGHTFYPSAPELRMRCDAAMKPIIDAQNKATRDRLQREEAATFKPVEHTPEERARVQEIYASFANGYVTDFKTEDQMIAEIRAKYDPDMLDAVPDAKTYFSRPRNAA